MMNQFGLKFFIVSVIFLLLGVYLVRIEHWGQIICFLLSAFLLYAAQIPVSKHHTAFSTLIHIFFQIFVRIVGYFALKSFIQATRNTRAEQTAVLKSLIKASSDTPYGRDHRLSTIKSIEDFQAKHPLTSYTDYWPYIERIVDNGEQGVLTNKKVIVIADTSGTTGKCKQIPIIDMVKLAYWRLILPRAYFLQSKLRTRTPKLAPLKTLSFLFNPRWHYSKSGFAIGPASAMTNRLSPGLLVSTLYSTPLEVGRAGYIGEPVQSYLHWLFALADQELGQIETSFGGTLLVALDFLRDNWQQLVGDVRSGLLHTPNNYKIPTECLAQLQRRVKTIADKKRADFLQQEFENGFEGIVQRLWPRIECVTCTVSGAHAIYIDRLRWYLGPKIRLFSTMFGASEGLFGLNIDPDTSPSQTYTLLPNVTFFEFIDQDEIGQVKPTGRLLLMDELKVGRRYEIVVTTLAGLFRYRIGDIVEVVGFRNSAPIVAFRARVGSLLDLRGEKTSEDMLLKAIESSLIIWSKNFQLVDFTATESLSFSKAFKPFQLNVDNEEDEQLYYIIFLEVKGLCRTISESETTIFDAKLGEINQFYKSFRSKLKSGPARLITVTVGTFEAMKRMTLEKNKTVSNQYKTPRYIKAEDTLRFLLSRCYA